MLSKLVVSDQRFVCRLVVSFEWFDCVIRVIRLCHSGHSSGLVKDSTGVDFIG